MQTENVEKCADDQQIGEKNNEDYDPHLERDVKKPTTNLDTFIHILKSILGTGMLAMPKAFYHSGYVIGLIFTVLIGILVTYCTHVLIRSQYILCKRHRVPSLTYKLTMRRALESGPPCLRRIAPFTGRIVNGFMLVQQIGSGTVYVIFIAQNLEAAFRSQWDVHIRYYILCLLIPLLGLACVRRLKYLAPLAFVGNLCILAGVILILTYVLKKEEGLNLDITKIEPAGNVLDFPLYFGTVLFALVCVNVILSLELEMKTPKSLVSPLGALNFALGTSTVLYAVFGFLGYLKFRDRIEDTITVNLPASDLVVKITQVLFAYDIFISFGISMFVAFEIVWKLWSVHFKTDWKREYIIRILTTLVPFALAMAFQKMGLIISLFGALCLSMLGLTFPAVIELCVLYPNFGRFQHVLIRNTIIIIISIFALVTGVVKSIYDIIEEFNKDSK